MQNFSLPRPVIHKIQVKTHKNTNCTLKACCTDIYFLLADTPLEYPRSFVLGGKKIFKVGDKGGKGKKKKLGKKLKEKKVRNGKGKKNMEGGRIEPPSRVSISLKSPMPYPSPTVTLKLHYEPGGLDKKFLLSQQFKYSMRLFEAKNVSFC